MLIWINGAFGSGKSLVAHELQRRLRDAHLADPEILGFALHKMLPPSARQDFQDLPQWRSGVVATLTDAEAASDGEVIVPIGQVLGRDETWASHQIERCVTALAGTRYATHVATDDRTPDEVVEFIARDARLELIAPRFSPARERLRRLEVGMRQIRF